MAKIAEQSLGGVTLFDGISEEILHDLEAHCHWRSYATGQQIVSHLDGSNDVFFVISGRVRVIIYSATGKAIAFRDIESGGIFGEFAAIDGMPRSASVEGLDPGTVAQLSSDLFVQALTSKPSLMKAMFLHLVGQVRALTGRVFEYSALTVDSRIQAELLRLAGQYEPHGDKVTITRMPTHSDLASRISTHREAVTRELNRLAQTGLIERRGAGVVITDLPLLVRMVREATGE